MKLHFAIWPIFIFPIASLLNFGREPAFREIMTSQQLFITKLTPIKGRGKKKEQKFEAELRDAFKIIKYKGDSTYVELDWTLCPDGKCPEIGQFKEGSLDYSKIDSLIRVVRRK